MRLGLAPSCGLLLVLLAGCWHPAPDRQEEAAAQTVLRVAQALEGHSEPSASRQLERWQTRLSPGLYARVQLELEEGALSVDTFTLMTAQLLGVEASDVVGSGRSDLERLGLGAPFDQNRDGLLGITELEVFLGRANPVTPTLFEYERPLGPRRPVPLPW